MSGLDRFTANLLNCGTDPAIPDLLAEACKIHGSVKVTAKGTSMTPVIEENDEITIARVDTKHIKPGAIVAYKVGCISATHRVVTDLGDTLLTKGDKCAQLVPVPKSDIWGKVIAVSKSGCTLRGKSLGYGSYLDRGDIESFLRQVSHVTTERYPDALVLSCGSFANALDQYPGTIAVALISDDATHLGNLKRLRDWWQNHDRRTIKDLLCLSPLVFRRKEFETWINRVGLCDVPTKYRHWGDHSLARRGDAIRLNAFSLLCELSRPYSLLHVSPSVTIRLLDRTKLILEWMNAQTKCHSSPRAHQPLDSYLDYLGCRGRIIDFATLVASDYVARLSSLRDLADALGIGDGIADPAVSSGENTVEVLPQGHDPSKRVVLVPMESPSVITKWIVESWPLLGNPSVEVFLTDAFSLNLSALTDSQNMGDCVSDQLMTEVLLANGDFNRQNVHFISGYLEGSIAYTKACIRRNDVRGSGSSRLVRTKRTLADLLFVLELVRRGTMQPSVDSKHRLEMLGQGILTSASSDVPRIAHEVGGSESAAYYGRPLEVLDTMERELVS